MSPPASPSRGGLTIRLMAAFALVIALAGAAAWVVAAAIGPGVFHRHLVAAGLGGDAAALAHAEAAFRSASGASLAIALAAAALAALALSLLITRRVTATIGALSRASRRIADGQLDARVSSPRLGAEFDGLAEAFNQMGSALQGSQQLRDRLLGDVAHELRTPVATITGYLEALEDGIAELDPATVAILRAQGERLTRLASDLAAVARAQDPLAGLSLEVVSAASVLDEAARSAGPGFAAKSVALEVDADAAVRVRVDRPRFAQVLANLLENALRHTPAGGVVRLTAALVEGSAGGAGGAVEGGVDGGAGDRADGEAGDGTDGQADGGADDGRDGASASRVDGERHLADGRAALEDGGTDGAADLADGGAVDAGGGGPGGVVRIIVADSGDGIGQEHLANVFERFYRVDQARDRAHGGSGIGLAIAKALTEAHGGRITAASDGPDRGATFTLDLPAVEP